MAGDALAKSNVTQLAATIQTWTPDQKDLIRRTVAKDCTDDELAMFLHVAAKAQLDPLLKQIHCTKMGGRLAFIADINGLQARAAREADFEGIDHAVVYEKDVFEVDAKTGEIVAHKSNPFANGRPIGAWAVVHRKGKKPFRSMVRFSEYTQNNQMWNTKPAVMIDKVAKSTALRLAYPEQLGNLYSPEEMGRDERELNPEPQPVEPKVLPAQSGTIVAPRTASARAAQAAAAKAAPAPSMIVDVVEGQSETEAAALHAARERCLALGRKAGFDKKGFAAWFALRSNGKTWTATTMDDLAKLIAMLETEPPPDVALPGDSGQGEEAGA